MCDKICDLPEGYEPSEDEEFMGPCQLEYFRRKLVDWREELSRSNEEVVKYLQEEGKTCTDNVDRAATETDMAYELRSKERAGKLISKINAALLRIQNGTYGFCEETGEPIGLRRLKARPVAMLSIEAQERHEKQERVQNG